MKDRPLPLLPLVLARVPRSLRRILAQTGIPFVEQAAAPAASRFVVFDSAFGSHHAIPGQTAIDIHSLRSGCRQDPFDLLDDERTVCRAWRIGALWPQEIVARVDKRLLRERLLAGLRKLIECAGGVWLRISAFPYGYRAAFNFRIDHDEYVASDFTATLAAVAGYEDCVSHYVCASTHAPHGESLARLSGCHVGSHGFWHHTYADAAANFRNLRRGIEALRSAGLDPAGFAAPHGRFNSGLHEALEALAIDHSSEFGLGYDDLPFFPRDGRVLQLPVHPICLGVCLEAAREKAPDHSFIDAAEIALSHFQRIIAEKREAGEPIFLYGHPDGRLGRFPHVLKATLKAATRHHDVWRVTLANYAAWWRRRSRVALQVSQEAGKCVVTATGASSKDRFALEYCRGDEVIAFPLSAVPLHISPDQFFVQAMRLRPRAELPTVDRPETFRATLRRYLDWERITPLEEINMQTWRGWAKRTLRRIKARTQPVVSKTI